MQTSEVALHQDQKIHGDPQQLTLPLEMFRNEAGTSASDAARTPTTEAAQPRTCDPSEVLKTLAVAEWKRIKNSWMQTMREVLDERDDR